MTIEEDTIKVLADNNTFYDNIEKQSTRRDRIVDSFAKFVGSWSFIFIFFTFLFSWVIVNLTCLYYQPFDPYPYIFLNLVLGIIAAIQAPIIMMSQNRSSEVDRLRDMHVYEVIIRNEVLLKYLVDAEEKR